MRIGRECREIGFRRGQSVSVAPSVRFLKDAHGHRVAYAIQGAGPVLVCPAWWVSHLEKDWKDPHFSAFFSRLAEAFTVVRYDRPGVGLSDREVPPRTLEAETRLLGDLIDHLGAATVSFLCISCGGPPAIQYAVRHPQRVSRIVFANSFARGADLGPPPVREALLSLVRASWGMGSKALADVFFPDADGATAVEFSRAQRNRADVTRAADLLELTFAMDATEDLARMHTEAIVIHRRGDRAVPFEAGRRLAAELPNATLVPCAGNLHLPWIEGSDIADVIVRFLQGEPADTATQARAASRDPTAEPCGLDVANRALVVDGERVSLTPLEFGVIRRLVDRRGTVVTRDELLEDVWKQPFAGSNKVDAVVRTLRRKLGHYATAVETVTGHGYRFAGWSVTDATFVGAVRP
jgi:pimeloyl-ACP methyl ester carboxylesterase/DNA-binding winged helix-turn-helix (wHTH) protein